MASYFCIGCSRNEYGKRKVEDKEDKLQVQTGMEFKKIVKFDWNKKVPDEKIIDLYSIDSFRNCMNKIENFTAVDYLMTWVHHE